MGAVCMCLSALVAEAVIARLGLINVIVISVIVPSLRLFLYGVIRVSPPYHAYVLSLFDLFGPGIQWIALVSYCYKITPSNLVATMIAVSASMQHVLGETTTTLRSRIEGSL